MDEVVVHRSDAIINVSLDSRQEFILPPTISLRRGWRIAEHAHPAHRVHNSGQNEGADAHNDLKQHTG
jgi:hypothetical protein